MSEENPRWLTVAEACEAIQVSPRTWEKWRARGKTPAATRLPNGTLRIRSDHLEAWMASLSETAI